MQAKDVMTTKVVTIAEDTEVGAIARVLLEQRISGVPVVDEAGRVLGIVSEGDLMRRPESGTAPQRSWWLRLVASPEDKAHDYVKTHGMRAADVMTRNVVTVVEDSGVGAIAQLLEERRIKRVPVIRDGKLVGIVSRANLLHGLVAHNKQIGEAPSPDDRSIRDQVIAELKEQGWVTHGSLNVIVSDGVVELWGWVESEEERKAFRIAAETVPGVRAVEDHLGSVPPWVWGA